MKKLSLVTKIFFFSWGCLLSSPLLAKSANLKDAFKTNDGSNADNLDSAAKGMGFNTGQTGIDSLVGSIIQIALSFLGVVFIVLIVYGGYLYMTAHGNDQQVEKAKSLIRAAIIGLIIIVASYAISYFVISRLGGETLQQSTPQGTL